jgi:hypothetical protein
MDIDSSDIDIDIETEDRTDFGYLFYLLFPRF